jgi:hypothetical protein
MKHQISEQFTPKQRALLLLNKYQLDYVKDIVNGMIYNSRKENETEICNYWNEVAIEIKKIQDERRV